MKIYLIWGLGIGDWGLGIGDWAQFPITNTQLPNSKTPFPIPPTSLKYDSFFEGAKTFPDKLFVEKL